MRFIRMIRSSMRKVRAVAPDGVDIVYDLVGQATFVQSARAVRDGGKIITVGAASGKPQFDLAALAARRVEVKGGGTPPIRERRERSDCIRGTVRGHPIGHFW